MRWPLRYQLLVPFAGIMLAVVLAVSLTNAILAARRTQAQIERQLHDVAQTLLEANFPLTDSVLKQTRGLSGAEFLLTDARGNLRAASLAGVSLQSLPRTAPAPERFALGDPLTIGSREYFHSVIAVRPRGTQPEPMLLHLLYPRDVLRDARWQAAYPPLLVGGAFLAVAILSAIAIAARVTRPILELRQQLGRLVRGDFEPIPLPRRDDELRDLIGSVNTLADELDASRRAIQRSERLSLLGQLSGGLAHQLRNSVTGARIAVQLHQRRCDRIDQDSLSVALRQLNITEAHLQRFLTVGQPTAPRRARCDLRHTIDEVADLLAPACKHRAVDLQLDVDFGGPADLLADADQLRQLLLNLLVNAVEAAGTGGWVRVELAAHAEAMVVRVVDSGRGLDPKLVDRLFEPFATAKPEGIGLGLCVARRIAESHGGAIRYLDGEPTTFELTLPRGAEAGETKPVVGC